MPDTDEIKDVTSYYAGKGVLKAERKGRNTLVLTDLGGPNNITFDPKNWNNPYEIAYYWHPHDNSPQSSVLGSEFSYYSEAEVDGWQDKSLFDLFQLF